MCRAPPYVLPHNNICYVLLFTSFLKCISVPALQNGSRATITASEHQSPCGLFVASFFSCSCTHALQIVSDHFGWVAGVGGGSLSKQHLALFFVSDLYWGFSLLSFSPFSLAVSLQPRSTALDLSFWATSPISPF